jgi:4'-phosphopantetheinyl transferase EntD
MLVIQLPRTERAEAQQRTGTAQRHFILGRLAAHAAIRQILEMRERDAPLEIVTGPAGEPRVQEDGAPYPVSVSISHVSGMAAACAWRSARGYGAGVDLERVRPTRVAESDYAFSAQEQMLLAQLREGPVVAGLTGWVVKEAVWKALWPGQPASPATIEIRALSLAPGHAMVSVDDCGPTRGVVRPIRVDLGMVVGPDGEYVLAVAEVGVSERDLQGVPGGTALRLRLRA